MGRQHLGKPRGAREDDSYSADADDPLEPPHTARKSIVPQPNQIRSTLPQRRHAGHAASQAEQDSSSGRSFNMNSIRDTAISDPQAYGGRSDRSHRRPTPTALFPRLDRRDSTTPHRPGHRPMGGDLSDDEDAPKRGNPTTLQHDPPDQQHIRPDSSARRKRDDELQENTIPERPGQHQAGRGSNRDAREALAQSRHQSSERSSSTKAQPVPGRDQARRASPLIEELLERVLDNDLRGTCREFCRFVAKHPPIREDADTTRQLIFRGIAARRAQDTELFTRCITVAILFNRTKNGHRPEEELRDLSSGQRDAVREFQTSFGAVADYCAAKAGEPELRPAATSRSTAAASSVTANHHVTTTGIGERDTFYSKPIRPTAVTESVQRQDSSPIALKRPPPGDEITAQRPLYNEPRKRPFANRPPEEREGHPEGTRHRQSSYDLRRGRLHSSLPENEPLIPTQSEAAGTLEGAFLKRRGVEAKNFFQPGRVFAVYEYDELSDSEAEAHSDVSHSGRNIVTYVSVKQKEGDAFCWALRISSYGRRGLLSQALTDRERRAHGVIYSSQRPPPPQHAEYHMRHRPIKVELSPAAMPLHQTMRINYDSIEQILHKQEVRDIGVVEMSSMPYLDEYWKAYFNKS